MGESLPEGHRAWFGRSAAPGGKAVIVLTARIEAHTPERRELVQALLGWAAAARRESGFLGAHVYEDLEAPAAFCLVSQWDNRSAFEAHVCGPQFGVVLGALEVLAGRPQVSISELVDRSESDAFLTIRRLRDHKRAVPQDGPS